MQHRSSSSWSPLAPVVLLFGASCADAATLAASWNGGTGSYLDAARWSSAPLVPIDGGGNVFDATIGGAADNVTFGGGAAAAVHSLTLGSGTHFTVDGAGSVFTPGTLVFDRANLAATGGGVLAGAAATSYAAANGTGAQRELIASGSGSVLDLSGLTSVTRPNGFASLLRLTATAGGRLDLPGLSTFTQPAGTSGGLTITANGTGSRVELPLVTALDRTTLEVLNGGTVTARLQQFTNGALRLAGAGVIDLSALANGANSQFTAENGATLDLGTATFDGANLIARNSATGAGGAASQVRSSATHYAAGSGTGAQRQFLASGAGSTLDLGAITSFVRLAGTVSNMTVSAENGGLVDLHSLAAFTANPAGDGGLKLRAAGAGSVLDLPLLTNLAKATLELGAGGTFTGHLQSLTDGTLSVNGAVNLDLAALLTAAGSSLVAENGATLALGATNLDRTSLYARYGFQGTTAAMIATDATSYAGGSGIGAQREFIADGAGSLLDLHTLAAFTRVTGTVATQRIAATNGGRIDLGGLSAFTDPANGTGQLAISADGAGSVVALPLVSHFERAALTVANGGTIDTPLQRLIGGALTKRVSGTIDLSGLVDGSESAFAAEDGALLDLGAPTLDGTSLSARRSAATAPGGARLVAGITSYLGGSGIAHQREFLADGAGSVVELAALQTIVRPSGAGSQLAIKATAGGRVTLDALGAVLDRSADNGAFAILADGAASTVALPALHALHGASLSVSNGGRIAARFVSLVDDTVTVGGTSDIDLSGLTDASGTTFIAENGKHWDLGTLALRGAGLIARRGGSGLAPATLTVGATRYDGGDAPFSIRQIIADGAGSALDLATLTSFQRLAGTNSILQIQASAGGHVDLSNVATFDTDAAHQGRVALLADGPGSAIDLPNLTVLSRGSLELRNGGRVTIGALQAIDDATLTLGDTTANALTFHAAATLTLGNGAVVDVAAHAAGAVISPDPGASGAAGTLSVLAGGRLAGNGMVIGTLLNAGTLAPGASPGVINVAGNYVQEAGGVLDFEFGGNPLSLAFDRLTVSGTAQLDGTLDVTLLDPGPVAGTRVFDFLSAKDGLSGQLALGTCNGCDGYTLALAVGPTVATLTVTRASPVPLPASGMLMLGALTALRRRAGRAE